MDEVESVANNNEWQLFSQLGFLQEVLDLLGVIMVYFEEKN